MLIICLLSSPGDASVIKQISFSSYQPTEGLWEPKIIELLCFLRQGVWKVGPEREKEREKSKAQEELLDYCWGFLLHCFSPLCAVVAGVTRREWTETAARVYISWALMSKFWVPNSEKKQKQKQKQMSSEKETEKKRERNPTQEALNQRLGIGSNSLLL